MRSPKAEAPVTLNCEINSQNNDVRERASDSNVVASNEDVDHGRSVESGVVSNNFIESDSDSDSDGSYEPAEKDDEEEHMIPGQSIEECDNISATGSASETDHTSEDSEMLDLD